MTLTKDLVENPTLWRLSIEIGAQAVDVVINTPLEDHALIYRHIPLDPALSPLAAFEEIIYDNPLLLADFKKVDILVNSPCFTIAPAEIRSDEAREAIFQSLWPQPGIAVMANALPMSETLLFGVDQGLVSFVRRTFLDSEIRHPLSVLSAYFGVKSQQSNSSKLYVRARKGYVDLMGFSRDRLLMANTIEAQSVPDVAYYALAAAQSCGLKLDHDEIFVCGQSDMREPVMEQMRQMARFVMPVIFPSELFRAGKDALNAPFELIILPLCE